MNSFLDKLTFEALEYQIFLYCSFFISLLTFVFSFSNHNADWIPFFVMSIISFIISLFIYFFYEDKFSFSVSCIIKKKYSHLKQTIKRFNDNDFLALLFFLSDKKTFYSLDILISNYNYEFKNLNIIDYQNCSDEFNFILAKNKSFRELLKIHDKKAFKKYVLEKKKLNNILLF